MHDQVNIIQNAVLILICAGLMGALFSFIRLPAVLAFILTGIMLGPGGLHWVDNTAMIQTIAEVGIIVLMFILGLELSLPKLKAMRGHTIIVGLGQMVLCTVLFTMAFISMGHAFKMALFLGATLGFSSTAIVLNQLNNLNQLETVHGRMMMGILVVQDLLLIPLMAFMPILLDNNALPWWHNLGLVVGKTFLFVLVSALCAWQGHKWIDAMAYRASKEVFAVSAFSFSLLMAFVAHMLGLSYAVGAFVAGLCLSSGITSRYVALHSVPFRDICCTIFFVSVGLLLNIPFLLNHWQSIVLFTALVMGVKIMVVGGLIIACRYPLKTAMWCGFSLFQISEISFVILQTGVKTGALSENILNQLANTIVLSMMLTPLIIRHIPQWVNWVMAKYAQVSEGEVSLSTLLEPPIIEPESRKHVDMVVAGYGPVARQLLTLLEQYQLNMTVVEMNVKTVQRLKAQGLQCFFGDISHKEVLIEAGIEQAKCMAVTVPDTHSAMMAIQNAKRLNPDIICMARCRFREDINTLKAVGADLVIHEEWETGMGFVHGIFDLGVVQDDHMAHALHDMPRKLPDKHGGPDELPTEWSQFGRLSLMGDTKVQWITMPTNSPWVGLRLDQVDLRQKTGVTVLTVVTASGEQIANPSADYVICEKDTLVVMGTLPQLHLLETLV